LPLLFECFGPGLDQGDFTSFLSCSVSLGVIFSVLMQLIFGRLSRLDPPYLSLRLATPRLLVSLWLPGYFAALGCLYIIGAGNALFTGSSFADDYLLVGVPLLFCGLLGSIALQAIFSTFGPTQYYPRRLEEVGARKLLSFWLPVALFVGGAVLVLLAAVFAVGGTTDSLAFSFLAFILLAPGTITLILMQSLYGYVYPANPGSRALAILGLVFSIFTGLVVCGMVYFVANFSMH
jgi:hypothetical protein